MTKTPKVTVVVPALNEARRIKDCIEALRKQDIPSDCYEILVVDNGSIDRTKDVCNEIGVLVLDERKRSPYCARNLGIEHTDSEWLAFTDAGCIADSSWLSELLACAERSDADLVGGLTRYQPGKKVSFGDLLHVQSHSPEILQNAIQQHHCIAGNNILVRRKVFNDVGVFRETRSGSDIEFSNRAHRAGFRIAFAPEATTIHRCELGNFGYLKRTFRIRYGQAQHSTASGIAGLISNLRTVPIRPGFRAPSPKSIESGPLLRHVSWRFYVWANRWMGFFGAQWAQTEKVFGSKRL